MAAKSGTAKSGAKKKQSGSTKKSTTTKRAPAKSGSSKASGSGSQRSRRATSENRPQNNQFWSVVLTAIGVLCAIIALVPGDKLWLSMHNILRGFFGISIFLVPAILFYTGFLIGQDRNRQASGRARWGILLILFASTFVQIFFGEQPDPELTVGMEWFEKFWTEVKFLFESGKELHGGGLVSGIVSVPLLALFDTIGAKIIIIMLIVVMVLLLTNKSIVELLQLLCSPFVWVWQKIVSLATRGIEDYDDLYEDEDDDDDYDDYEDEEEVLPEAEDDNEEFPIFERGRRRRQAETEQNPEEQQRLPEPRRRSSARRTEQRRLDEVTFMLDRALLRQEGGNNIDVDVPIYDDSGASPAADEINRLIREEPESESTRNLMSDDDFRRLIEQSEIEPVPTEDANILPWADSPEEETDESLYDEAPETPYVMPPLTLLKRADNSARDADKSAELREKAEQLVDTLKSFGVQVRITGIRRGPAVTRYEIQPAAGVKISKITSLTDDIGLNLGGTAVRISQVEGKPALGVEVPNNTKDIVSLREILEAPEFQNSQSKLTIAVGKDIDGNVIVGDIAKMPHMIIAGTTGSGKSVCTNSIIMSILYHASPEEVRLLLIDPKVVEFQPYDGVPHLLIPVVTNPQKAAGALNWAVIEMERRYALCAQYGVRDLKGYNAVAERTIMLKKLPQIVIIIDEFADLMMAAGKEVEAAVIRIAQKARAAGIHLIIATQRPQADVITGLIKANIPSRIGMSVKSAIDSRIILDVSGAEALLGNGDLLFAPNGAREPKRVQGCYCSESEVEAVVSFLKSNGTSEYDTEIIEAVANNMPAQKGEKPADDDDVGELTGEEALCMKAAELAVDMGQLSTTALQRRLKLGYAKAARIVDELEQRGIIGPSEGAKPRKVLMTPQELTEWKLRVAAKGNQVNSTGM